MASFSIVTRAAVIGGQPQIKLGKPVPVYIRVAHGGGVGYIKTKYAVGIGGVGVVINQRGGSSVAVTDMRIIAGVSQMIVRYEERCRRYDLSRVNCKKLIEFLTQENESPNFNKYCQRFIDKMINEGREHPASNYQSAINSYRRFVGENDMLFRDVTTKKMQSWIESLKHTATAKRAYPSALKTMFYSGRDFYNDYDRNIIVVSNDPFRQIKLPRISAPVKRNIAELDILRSILAYKAPEEFVRCSFHPDKMVRSRDSLAADVAKMIFCLAGINAADLYAMESSCIKKGKLCYNRQKTKGKRFDRAYIEIAIPEEIKHLIEKYKGEKRAFCFCEHYYNANSFVQICNKGLKKICAQLGVPAVTTYSFRHTWATIAQNHCGASMADVAFALNHVSGFGITERYVSVDYSPIDRLNRKVIDFVMKGYD